jgi:hypothetical protein
MAGLGGDALFAVRNVFQLLRLIYLVKNQQRTKNILMSMIDFSKLAQQNSPMNQTDSMIDSEMKFSKIASNTAR